MDHTAKQEISAFLKERHSLEVFTQVIKYLHFTATLNISFLIDAGCLLALAKSFFFQSLEN